MLIRDRCRAAALALRYAWLAYRGRRWNDMLKQLLRWPVLAALSPADSLAWFGRWQHADLQGLLRREVDNRLDVSQSRVDALASALAGADREIEKRQALLATMPDKQVKLAGMDQEISVLRTRYEGLSKDVHMAKVTSQTTPRVSV